PRTGDHFAHPVPPPNRLPVADMTTHPPTRRRYFAHLVSLAGFADYLGPNPRPIPRKPGTSDLMDVQMVSLCEWTFASMPQSSQSFAALMKNLIASEA